MSAQDETSRVLADNAKYAADYSSEKANLPMPPGRKLVIVACMDAVSRSAHTATAASHLLCPEPPLLHALNRRPRFLLCVRAVLLCPSQRLETGRLAGLVEGDAHVIRNAGGRIHDALRSITISQQLLGTQEVIIIHHTDCGMLTFDDSVLRSKLREQGLDGDHVAFLPFKDLEQSVRDDIALYHASPLVRHDVPVRGFIYDVKTGKLNEVSAKK